MIDDQTSKCGADAYFISISSMGSEILPFPSIKVQTWLPGEESVCTAEGKEMGSLPFPCNCSVHPLYRRASFFNSHSPTVLKYLPATVLCWGLQSKLEINSITHRINSQKFQALINATKGGKSGDEILMVDPVEAKRLADIQMQKIKAKEKLKMQRKIEAINGAWAMIGLTAGLIIEGQTGNGILAQLAGYWGAFIGLFFR
ncbi:uncharacterized protein [Aristolochia californica]|uniref:uncharacterized protein isoform X1 n=1 Tax=Aristolochia californica TaxID=171875 RepID=UPI0035DFECF8